MRKETRIAYNGYLGHVAKLNGVDSASDKFNVEPTIQQKLETAIQESNGLLNQINVIGVMEQSGEALLLGVNGPIAAAPTPPAAIAGIRPIVIRWARTSTPANKPTLTVVSPTPCSMPGPSSRTSRCA